jgi:hypothetical protein
MKIKKTQTKVCGNCLSKIPLQQKTGAWKGYKIRNGHVFCKECSTEIK